MKTKSETKLLSVRQARVGLARRKGAAYGEGRLEQLLITYDHFAARFARFIPTELIDSWRAGLFGMVQSSGWQAPQGVHPASVAAASDICCTSSSSMKRMRMQLSVWYRGTPGTTVT